MSHEGQRGAVSGAGSEGWWSSERIWKEGRRRGGRNGINQGVRYIAHKIYKSVLQVRFTVVRTVLIPTIIRQPAVSEPLSVLPHPVRQPEVLSHRQGPLAIAQSPATLVSGCHAGVTRSLAVSSPPPQRINRSPLLVVRIRKGSGYRSCRGGSWFQARAACDEEEVDIRILGGDRGALEILCVW